VSNIGRAACDVHARYRASTLKLATLPPRIVLIGHGRPLLDGAKFADFAARLPEES
jgi:hypothetical protein